jgi:ATPase family associated with various cellular activities (AAA)
MASDEKVEIIVIGDVYWDTVIFPLPSDHKNTDRPQNAYARIDRPGGAWLLETLIETATGIKVKGYGTKKPKDNEYGIDIEDMRDDDKLRPDNCPRALTVMELCYKDAEEKEKEKVYRIRSRRGYGWVQPGGKYPLKAEEYIKLNAKVEQKLTKSPGVSRIVVISETENHPFRSVKENVEFVKKIASLKNSYLVFFMAHPLGEGALWNMIKENKDLVDRTLVVISAASLRAGGLYVREQAAQETIARELARKFVKTKIQDLNECPHIVVRFDYDSVFHYDTRKKYCENDTVEGCFDNYLRPFEGGPQTNPGRYGTMAGYGKILVASVVEEMAEGIKTGKPFDRLGKGICDGLRRGAAHFRNGFAAKGFEDNYLTKGEEPTPFENLFKKRTSENSTPIKELFRQSYIDDDGEPKLKEKVDLLPLLAKVHMPCDEKRLETWSRVEGLEKEIKEINDQNKTFDSCLVDVVKVGLEKALEEHKINVSDLPEDEWPIACPFLKLGALISIERDELDGFNDVYVLIQKYLQDDSSKKPLSLAVFGPPGTGKSFAVQEIMKAAGSPSGKSATADILENNLSQFTEPKSLARAFHKAQDVALSGKVPLVFFDEFDASLPDQPYGWLKYFLSPMQDGKFKAADSEDSYTVGRAIFVFAGGINPEFKKFKDETTTDVGKNAKVPDFISRLRGHLNILSINNGLEVEDKSEKKPEIVQAIDRLTQTINIIGSDKKIIGSDKKEEDSPDKETSEAKQKIDCRLLLRRAILLRSVLEKEANEIIDSKKQARIDDGVINAFLRIDRYEHRMRSMEAIVKMARPDKNWLRVASLPSRDQLGMHVDAARFLELAQPEEPRPDAASGATDAAPKPNPSTG